MIETIASNSVREGRTWSRLPELTETWKSYIKGSADFFSLNYYTSRFINTTNEFDGQRPSWLKDVNLSYSVSPFWPQAKAKWLYSISDGLHGILKYVRRFHLHFCITTTGAQVSLISRWIKDEYDNPELIITEIGWADDGELNDTGRITFLRDHLKATLKAIHEDGCNVRGFTVWSIIDNFEWLAGFT